jgi:hypothetical protein
MVCYDELVEESNGDEVVMGRDRAKAEVLREKE